MKTAECNWDTKYQRKDYLNILIKETYKDHGGKDIDKIVDYAFNPINSL